MESAHYEVVLLFGRSCGIVIIFEQFTLIFDLLVLRSGFYVKVCLIGILCVRRSGPIPLVALNPDLPPVFRVFNLSNSPD